MGYLLKAGIGLALFFGGIVLFNVKLMELLDVGTCASGNQPFEIAQGYECPDGTGTDSMLLVVGIFAGLIGAGIFAFRGEPPWGGGRRRATGLFGIGTLAWGLFFAGTGAALLIGMPYGEVVDPETGETVARADSQLGAQITGWTFLVMGVPALLIAGWSLAKGFGKRDERPAAATAGAGPAGGIMGSMRSGMESVSSTLGRSSGGGDAIGKIERLQKLRESGAINDAEFEREKAKILAEQ
jgi:hypothetical protein